MISMEYIVLFNHDQEPVRCEGQSKNHFFIKKSDLAISIRELNYLPYFYKTIINITPYNMISKYTHECNIIESDTTFKKIWDDSRLITDELMYMSLKYFPEIVNTVGNYQSENEEVMLHQLKAFFMYEKINMLRKFFKRKHVDLCDDFYLKLSKLVVRNCNVNALIYLRKSVDMEEYLGKLYIESIDVKNYDVTVYLIKNNIKMEGNVVNEIIKNAEFEILRMARNKNLFLLNQVDCKFMMGPSDVIFKLIELFNSLRFSSEVAIIASELGRIDILKKIEFTNHQWEIVFTHYIKMIEHKREDVINFYKTKIDVNGVILNVSIETNDDSLMKYTNLDGEIVKNMAKSLSENIFLWLTRNGFSSFLSICRKYIREMFFRKN